MLEGGLGDEPDQVSTRTHDERDAVARGLPLRTVLARSRRTRSTGRPATRSRRDWRSSSVWSDICGSEGRMPMSRSLSGRKPSRAAEPKSRARRSEEPSRRTAMSRSSTPGSADATHGVYPEAPNPSRGGAPSGVQPSARAGVALARAGRLMREKRCDCGGRRSRRAKVSAEVARGRPGYRRDVLVPGLRAGEGRPATAWPAVGDPQPRRQDAERYSGGPRVIDPTNRTVLRGPRRPRWRG